MSLHTMDYYGLCWWMARMLGTIASGEKLEKFFFTEVITSWYIEPYAPFWSICLINAPKTKRKSASIWTNGTEWRGNVELQFLIHSISNHR